jgi:H+/gluconate symporter-like permease
MGDSHAAASIALALVRRLGAHRALWITVIACAMLTYGGVVVFVVVFATYPLGLKLLEEADIPKRLFVAALTLGAGTFTLTSMPGTPSIHNVISSVALGTDLFAGFWMASGTWSGSGNSRQKTAITLFPAPVTASPAWLKCATRTG